MTLSDPRLAIRTGIYNALLGAISFNSQVLQVYDVSAIPFSASKPYITIGAQTITADNTKDRFGYSTTFQVGVSTTSSANNQAGEKSANQIMQSIQSVLVPSRTGFGFSASGFDLYSIELDSDTLIKSNSGVESEIFFVCVFRVKCFQN